MRSFVIAIASSVLFATVVQAADDAASPVAGKLPDNTVPQQVFLFTLKKNGLSIRMDPQSFCHDLGYGDAAKRSDDPQKGFWERANDEISKDDGKTKIPGELIWVICQFPAKSSAPPR